MPIRVLPFEMEALAGDAASPLPAVTGAGLAALLRERLDALAPAAELTVSGILWVGDAWQAELRVATPAGEVMRHHEAAAWELGHHLLYRLFAHVAGRAGAAIPGAATLAFDDYRTSRPGALLEYLRGLGETDAAARRAAWRRSFEIDAGLAATRIALARERLQAGDAAAAAGLLDGLPIADAGAAAELGIALWSLGESEVAAALLAAAIAGQPEHALAHAALAALLARRGGGSEAVYLATRAAELESDDYRTWAALAEVYRLQGDFRQASFYYGFALRLEPGAPAVLKDAGATWLLAGDEERALPLIQRAIAAAPGDAENYGNLACAHDRLADAAAALAAAQRAAALAPTNVRLHLLLGDLALKAGQREAASRAWTHAAALDPDLRIDPAGGNLARSSPPPQPRGNQS